MKIFRSKCEACGDYSYIFPDQLEIIKKNDNLKLHKYCKGKLSVGSEWFCIKCDASKKDGTRCKIYAEIVGEDAKKKIDIRKRETSLRSHGFILPTMF